QVAIRVDAASKVEVLAGVKRGVAVGENTKLENGHGDFLHHPIQLDFRIAGASGSHGELEGSDEALKAGERAVPSDSSGAISQHIAARIGSGNQIGRGTEDKRRGAERRTSGRRAGGRHTIEGVGHTYVGCGRA